MHSIIQQIAAENIFSQVSQPATSETEPHAQPTNGDRVEISDEARKLLDESM